MDKPPKLTFTIEELLAEIAAKDGGGIGGATARELVRRTGRSRGWVCDQLRLLIDHNQAEYAGLRDQASIDGRLRSVPAYRLRVSLSVDSEE